ncbi:adenosine deaminase [Amycolatopsis sp. NPDC005003]
MTAGAFVAALPKVELHVHLLGSADLATVAELAARHPGRGVPRDLAALERFCAFTGFAHFLEVYTAVNRLVTAGADLLTLVTGLRREFARNRVRYAEVTVTPLSHLKSGMAPEEIAEALDEGRARAACAGIDIAWIFDASGDDGPDGAEAALDWVLRHQPAGTVGFGLGGPEAGVPRRLFRDVFRRARAAGLRSVPHAGETTGPEEVRSAVVDLRADRIGHGIGCVRDPWLTAELSERGITLEICPTSNLRTRAVAGLAAHPLPALLAAGVPVTLGSDDPGLFGCSLNGEYRLCRDEFGLTEAELRSLARAGARAAFCPPATREALLREIDSTRTVH